jgi:hypothetical protein
MKFCQKRKKKIRFRFFLILSSYFLLNWKQKFSFSFLTRDLQVVLVKWFYFWLFIRASII